MDKLFIGTPRLNGRSAFLDELYKHFCSTSSIWYDCNLNLNPDKVIFDFPATIVYWNDGTKTAVVCHDSDTYDEHEGFLLCCAKKLFGNTGRYNDIIRESTPDANQLQRAINVMLHPYNLTANPLPGECEGDAR